MDKRTCKTCKREVSVLYAGECWRCCDEKLIEHIHPKVVLGD